MPTNRFRRLRPRIGDAGVTEAMYVFFKWAGTLSNDYGIRFFDLPDPERGEAICAEWQKHRAVLIARYAAEMRDRGQVGRRLRHHVEELEAQHPRRKTGTARWIGPVRSDGGDRMVTETVYETDLQYLKRLGLLEPWELQGSKGAPGRPAHGRAATIHRESSDHNSHESRH